MLPDVLYHGTSYENWCKVRDEGVLKGRGGTLETNWKEIPSNPDAVYLTTCYAPYFAMNASADTNDSWVILEIATAGLERSRFRPDEDVLEQCSRGQEVDFMPTHIQIGSMAARTEWFRENLGIFSHLTEESLSLMGTCSYSGRIEMRHITRWSTVDREEFPMLCGMIDPQITPMNFLIKGESYEEITRAMLGYDIDMEKIFKVGETTFFGQIEESDPAYNRLLEELKTIKRGRN